MGVTKPLLLKTLLLVAALFSCRYALSAVLPEDRTDVLYHRYSGGGINIDGPSVLVRKQFKDKVSVWGNYYVDKISGASIDLLAKGSSFYQEEREEHSFGMEYLHDRTILSVSKTNSSEKDYEANTFSFAVSQETFGDMTTLTMSYAQGNDDVRENIYMDSVITRTEFRGNARHQRFGFGVTQVLTEKWIMAFNAESVIDDGWLYNPYRDVRFSTGEKEASVEAEDYPTTRNSDAFAIRSMYYLPHRASLRLEFRTYMDSWGIDAKNIELRYIHPFKDRWVFEGKFRHYQQTQADFYSDLFPFSEATTFRARDKEMSAFSSKNFGVGATYTLPEEFIPFVEKSTINLYLDVLLFDYENFRENTPDNVAEFGAGNEPFYQFSANIVRLFLSLNY